MTAQKPAKKAPRNAQLAKPSQAERITHLEEQVAALKTQHENLAKFITSLIAQQLQAQLMGNPDLMNQLQQHMVTQQAQSGG